MYVMRKSLAFAGSFFLLGTMIVFFGVHTVAGERGMLARPQLERKIMLAEEQLALLERHQAFLSHRIGLMHKGGVDCFNFLSLFLARLECFAQIEKY